MKVVDTFLAAVGYSPWVPIDYWQSSPPSVSLALFVGNGSTLTATVDYTLDGMGADYQRIIGISQTTTTATITDTGPTGLGHGLATGDLVTIIGTPKNAAGITSIDGTYAVTVTSATQYTVTVVPSQTYNGTANVLSARIFPTTISAVGVRTVASLNVPATGVILNVTAFTAGAACLHVVQGGMSS
jgi:hypothetical protein